MWTTDLERMEQDTHDLYGGGHHVGTNQFTTSPIDSLLLWLNLGTDDVVSDQGISSTRTPSM